MRSTEDFLSGGNVSNSYCDKIERVEQKIPHMSLISSKLVFFDGLLLPKSQALQLKLAFRNAFKGPYKIAFTETKDLQVRWT